MNSKNHQILQSILLHAHLPYVRHPEHPKFFEENWLFEAISECYIPLISMLHRLDRDNIKGRLTFTLTPTLTSMLRDEVLTAKFSTRLKCLKELAENEAAKKRSDPKLSKVTAFYSSFFTEQLYLFEDVYSRDLISEFIKLRDSGRIEIIGCAATHALLALSENKSTIRSQVTTGINSYIETFNEKPRGIWMPECAYTPLVSEVLVESGIEYSIVDSHGILHGTPMPKYSVFAPVRDRNGLILFGRDPESSKQVWSAETGYPGDYAYREFYRDLGWDGDIDEIADCLSSSSFRHDIGLKYHRITGKVPLESKDIYNPDTAHDRACEHGKDFIQSRQRQGERLIAECNNSVHILSPYDAELFGHWWFEGPVFIESVLRAGSQSKVKLISLSDCIDTCMDLQKIDVATSSWGNNGYFETWLNGSNDWIFKNLQLAEDKLRELCSIFTNNIPTQAEKDALNQCARELVLAQSSDWQFILTTDTTTEYATSRVREHLSNVDKIYSMIKNNHIDPEFITALFKRNNIFPNIDYTAFA